MSEKDCVTTSEDRASLVDSFAKTEKTDAVNAGLVGSADRSRSMLLQGDLYERSSNTAHKAAKTASNKHVARNALSSGIHSLLADSELEGLDDAYCKGQTAIRTGKRLRNRFDKLTEKKYSRPKTPADQQRAIQAKRNYHMSRKYAAKRVAAQEAATATTGHKLMTFAGMQGGGGGLAAGIGGGSFTLGILGYLLTFILIVGAVAVIAGILSNDQSNGFNTEGLPENAATIAIYLHNKDVDNVHIAAILGNIEAESGFNFGSIEESNSIGHGICQWSFGRWSGTKGLANYSMHCGKVWTDPSVQLDFLWGEMTGQGSAADWGVNVQFNWGAFLQCSDIEDATGYFMIKFERPNANDSINHFSSRRLPNAKSYLEILNKNNSGSTAAGGEDYDKANPAQKHVADVAGSCNTLGSGAGYCQEWVEKVYRACGYTNIGYCCCATGGWEKWGVSSSSEIPVGAMVFGHSYGPVGGGCHSDWGHVGIYIGDGNVASNVGGIRVESLDSWVGTYGYRGWGWPVALK